MNDNTSGSQRRRAWPRRAGALTAVAGIAVLAACSSSPSSSTPGASASASTSSKYDKALAFSQCMRSHGVPDFPDPNSSGGFTYATPNGSGGSNGQPSNLNGAAKRTALNACRHLDPNGGTVTPAQQQQAFNQALRFSQCMRAHGLRDFPDPTGGSGGSGEVQTRIPSDINIQSSQFQSAQRACRSLQPGAGQPGGAP
jgi:hypothetical protein